MSDEVKPLAPEVVENELNTILDAFDVPRPKDEKSGKNLEPLRRAISDGLVVLDESGDAPTIKFSLRKPVKNETTGEIVLASVTLREPETKEVKRINRGVKLTIEDESAEMDMGDATQKTINALTTLGGVPLGLVDRILNRDLKVLSVIAGFFG